MGCTSQGATRVVLSGDRSLGSSVENSMPSRSATFCTPGQVSPPSIMMNLTPSSLISLVAPVRALAASYSLS